MQEKILMVLIIRLRDAYIFMRDHSEGLLESTYHLLTEFCECSIIFIDRLKITLVFNGETK